MSPRKTTLLTVDDQGRLSLPPDLLERLHAQPGQVIPVTVEGPGLVLGRSIECLSRVYIEPTSRCNFDCLTCMRNAWDEPPGDMDEETFARVLDALRSTRPAPLAFFGGYGEPLAHPRILEMVCRAKATGAAVELITNGSLLDETCSRALIAAGLDRLWVSIDGATPQGYSDVRLGEALELVIENLERLGALRLSTGLPRLGIAFVAMRRNLSELPAVIRLGRHLGADRFSISHVLAHTPALRDEVLYDRALDEPAQGISEGAPEIALPRMAASPGLGAVLGEALQGRAILQIAGQPLRLGSNTCPFVQKGSVSIRWDGSVSPCLALLHSHTSYLGDTRRAVRACSLGSLKQTALLEIWNSPAYHDLRVQLAAFDFSPCVYCNSCENSASNQEDCFGNTAPACGGCLWAQGFIQCP